MSKQKNANNEIKWPNLKWANEEEMCFWWHKLEMKTERDSNTKKIVWGRGFLLLSFTTVVQVDHHRLESRETERRSYRKEYENNRENGDEDIKDKFTVIIAGTETVLVVKMEGGAAIGKGGGHNERTEVGAELHITTRERGNTVTWMAMGFSSEEM